MKIFLSSLQWMIFMIAGAIAAPIAIADLYQLSIHETTYLVQNTILILGISGLLQGILGHKLPIHEGPAGLWWSVFTVYASLIGVLYISPHEALQALSGGMLISGILFIIVSVSGLIDKLTTLFTPTVTFVYLLLLILQLSGTFMRGMLGITATNESIDILTTILSITVVVITLYFGRCKFKLLNRFSIIMSIGFGWLLFILFGNNKITNQSDEIFKLPKIMPFGIPTFDLGTIVMAMFLTLLLITNVIASIRLMEMALHKRSSARIYVRSSYTAGFNQLLSSISGGIASVPISGAVGFIQQTKITRRLPFILGCGFVISITLFPPIIGIVASIPAPVGYAVTFVIFTQMIGLAFKELKKVVNEERTYFVIGLAVMTGVGLMFVPASATIQLPPILIVLMNNGLILGSLLAIIMEQILLKKEK